MSSEPEMISGAGEPLVYVSQYTGPREPDGHHLQRVTLLAYPAEESLLARESFMLSLPGSRPGRLARQQRVRRGRPGPVRRARPVRLPAVLQGEQSPGGREAWVLRPVPRLDRRQMTRCEQCRRTELRWWERLREDWFPARESPISAMASTVASTINALSGTDEWFEVLTPYELHYSAWIESGDPEELTRMLRHVQPSDTKRS